MKIVKTNPRLMSISHGGSSVLKFSGRNSIVQFLTKINFIHFAYFRVVLDLCLGYNLLYGMRILFIASFRQVIEVSS